MEMKITNTWFNPYRISNILLQGAMEKSKQYASGIILDIGCGKKPYYDIFKDVVSSYIGLEHPNTPDENHKADVLGDGLRLPVKDNSINSVLCNQVLEHVPEPLVFLKEIQRVLKNKGVLIMTVPQTWGVHEEPNDFFRFTNYGMKYLCDKVGLNVIKIEQDSGTWASAGQRLVLILCRGSKFKRIAVSPFTALLQYMFFKLDRFSKKRGDTLNYLIVAKKGD
jgi:SAM-dependent methyltransferase